MTYISDICRQSPILIQLIGIILFSITRDPIFIFFTITAHLFGFLVNVLIKKILKYFFPTYKPFLRPNPPSWGCHCYKEDNKDNEDNKDKTKYGYGMPSGHSQMAGFAFMFWCMYVYIKYKNNKKSFIIASTVLFICMIAIMYSRVEEGCHTILQVVIGSLIGMTFGYILIKKYIK